MDAFNELPERISDEYIALFDDFLTKLTICAGIGIKT